MIDVAKQVEFWRAGSEEDFAVALDLIGRGRIRHGLFFLHLAVEKALKAEVCRETQDVAPRIHSLVRLADLAEVHFPGDQAETLVELNEFNIEGRYPELLSPVPSAAEARDYVARAQGILQWLNNRS
jgi:HEPN domain-containing protein